MEGRISREVEFEFQEDGGEGGFVVTDHVTAVITSHLGKGDVDKAASIIATTDPSIGDSLLEIAEKDPSPALRAALAEAFVQARDFERAGRAALLIGDPNRAAPFFERNYHLKQAADLYEAGGQFEKAAELHERDLRYEQAGQLYEKAEQPERAAAAYEGGGLLFRAGKIWAVGRRLNRAVEVLQRVESSSPDYAPAVWLLGRILESAGHNQAAALRYIEVVKSCPLDETTVDIYERLGAIYIVAGEKKAALKLLTAVNRFDPSRERAAKALQTLGVDVAWQGSPAERPRQSKPPKPSPAEARPSRSSPPQGADQEAPGRGVGAVGSSPPGPAPGSGQGVKPLVLPLPEGGAKVSHKASKVTTFNSQVDLLRKLPLFSEMTLDELRAFQSVGELKAFPKGATLIEQGQPGTDLIVVLSGTVIVTHVEPDGETVLGEFGYGSSLGEMALVDEGPTSARVRAKTDVSAFRWPMDRIRGHLNANEGTALRLLRVISRTLSVRLRETNRRVAIAAGQ